MSFFAYADAVGSRIKRALAKETAIPERPGKTWRTIQPILAEAGWLCLIGCFIMLQSAGSHWVGDDFLLWAEYAVVVGGFMLFRRSAARRAVGFAALLLSLWAMKSTMQESVRYSAKVQRLRMEAARRIQQDEINARSPASPAP